MPRGHLTECAECREALAELERVDASLARSLAHDPGDRYFERFASRVSERIAAEIRAASAPRRAARGGFLAWLLTPQGLGLAGSAAAVLVVGSLVYFQTQRASDLKRPELAARSDQVAPAPSDAAKNAPQREEAGLKESERRLDQLSPPGAGAPAATAVPPVAEKSNEFAPAPTSNDAGALQKRRDADEGATASRQPSPTPPAAAPTSPEAGARTGAASGSMTHVEKTKRGEEVPVTTKKMQGMPAPVTSGSSGPVAIKPEAQVMSGRSADSALQFHQEMNAKSTLDARDRAAPADASAQVQLCGRVTDGEGRPVAGAEVAVADVGRSVTAGADGRFCLQSPPGEHTVSVLRVGYEPLRQTITVAGAKSDMKLALRSVTVLQSPGGGSLGFTAEPKSGAASGAGWTGGWPAPVQQDVGLAQSTTELAARTKSAARYEDAARVWERVLTRLGSPAAQLEARDRIGENRWLAWQLDKTAARAANARTALTTFLGLRPTGERATLARERLAALGR